MQELLNELNELSKKKSKLSATGKKRAAEILNDVYNQNADIDWLCQELITLPVGVQAEFFANNYSDFASSDEIKFLVDTLISNETFIKNSSNEPAKRAIEIIDVYIKNNNFDANVCVLFNATLKVSTDKNYVVKDAFVTVFNKKIVENYRHDLLKFNFINDETLYLFLLLDKLIDKNLIDDKSYEFTSWNLYDEFITHEHRNIVTELIAKNKGKGRTKPPSQVNIVKELTAKVESLEQNQAVMLTILQDMQTKIDALTPTAVVEPAPTPVKEDTHSSKSNDALPSDVVALRKELTLEKEKSADLEKRLVDSFNMDDLAVNQKIVKLKNDISESLKLEHKEYKNNLDKSYNEDNFLAYRSTILRIFRTLGRLGIDFE